MLHQEGNSFSSLKHILSILILKEGSDSFQGDQAWAEFLCSLIHRDSYDNQETTPTSAISYKLRPFFASTSCLVTTSQNQALSQALTSNLIASQKHLLPPKPPTKRLHALQRSTIPFLPSIPISHNNLSSISSTDTQINLNPHKSLLVSAALSCNANNIFVLSLSSNKLNDFL